MHEDTLSLLKVHDYFRGLSEEVLLDVAEQADVAEFDVGACVHDSNEPFTDVCLVVRGRLKIIIVNDDGTESLFRIVHCGEQVGMLSAALPEPVPLRVIAVEPSTLLRLPYEVGLELTRKHLELRRRWNKKLASSLRTALLRDNSAPTTKTLTVFHEGPNSRELVGYLLRRLSQLGEKLCLFSDYPGMCPPAEVLLRPLRQGADYLSPMQVREQLAEWHNRDRILFDVSADIPHGVAARLVEISEQVLWCTCSDETKSAVQHLAALKSQAAAFCDKISLIWCLNDEHISPRLADIRNLTARQFVLTNAATRRPLGVTVANGPERLIHFLRGVQVGLALGGGAARGMAHLGVLKVLEENGIVIDMIGGTSAGAMTGIAYASGVDADYAAHRFAEDLQPSWGFRQLPRGAYWYLLYNYRCGRFDAMLRNYLEDWNLEQLPIPCFAVTVDLVSATAVVRDSGDAVRAILESINLPILSKPLLREGQALIDGGFLNNVPADVLVSKGCNFVIAVDVAAKIEARVGTIRPGTRTKKIRPPSILETVMRTYAVLSHNITAFGARPADVIIEPDVSTFDMADFTRAVEAANVGKETTSKQLVKLRKLLHRLDGSLFPMPEAN